MVKLALTTALAVLAFAAIASTSTAQETPFDPGETNLLTLACDDANYTAAQESVVVRNCRRHAPEQIDGQHAIVRVRVATEIGRFVFTGLTITVLR